jgi:hypothetical protein
MLGQREKVTRKEERQRILNAAHLLNKFQLMAHELGCPLTPQEEDDFWKFIAILPGDDQTSVIN